MNINKKLWWLSNTSTAEEEVQAEGNLTIVTGSDPHSYNNSVSGGQTNPIKFAWNALPAGIKSGAFFFKLLGDFFNNPNSNATRQGEVRTELSDIGMTDKVFALAGNHDDLGWGSFSFNNVLDPFGVDVDSNRNPANFPITPVGTIKCYYLKKGNFLNIMLSDDQDAASMMGESAADFGSKPYNAAGGYTSDNFRQAVYYVLANLDCNLVWSTHHPLKDTTIASGFDHGVLEGVAWINPETVLSNDWEVFRSSYLSFISNVPSERVFHDFFTAIAGTLVVYEHGHTHVGIDETDANGKGVYSTAYGIPMQNVACINDEVYLSSFRSYVTPNMKVDYISAKTFNRKTHVHITDGVRPTGYQADLEVNLTMPYNYNESYVSSNPSAPSAPSITSIDVSVKGCATLNINKGSAGGVLVVRKTGGYATFTPTADSIYLRGDAAGDGVVVYMGTVTDYQDHGLFGGTEYYSVFGFNGKNNKISFSSAAQQSATIVSADQAKILADLAIGDGSPVLYLDSRVGVTNNSGVELWADQSGNGLDAAQATAGNRPAVASDRITFSATGSKYLAVPYDALIYFGHPTAAWVRDVPISIFAKVRLTDATGFRICTKMSGANFEFQLCTNASDKLAIILYDTNSSNVGQYNSNIALTAYEGDDLFIFMDYLGCKKFVAGGIKLYVYDKDFNLIAYDNADTTGSAGSFAKMRNFSIPLDIGRHNATSADYSEGQINGLVIKKGDIMLAHEKNYLMDHFSFSDDL
jgi:hypothetical protein